MSNRITEKITLHFDLNHCPPDEEFSLGALSRKYKLTRHTPETFSKYSQKNKALALLAPEQQHRVTHFVEDVELPADAVGIHLVTYPNKDPNSIPELALPFVYIPTAAKRRHFRKQKKSAALQSHPSSLTHFGIAPGSLAPGEAAAVMLDATQVLTPFQAAETIIFNHPDLLTTREDVASTVIYDHISQTLHQDDTLPQYLSQNGPGTQDPYYAIVIATNPQTGAPINPVTTDENGNPIVDKDGNPITWPQQNGQNVVQQYKLSPAMKATPRAASLAAADTGSGFQWNLSNKTSTYGLDVDGGSLSYDTSSSTLSFNVKNWANRFLGAYVQFFDDDGNPINDPWNQGNTNQSKMYVTKLSSGNTLAGIPIWTSYTPISFVVPSSAVKADVLLGGMGIGNRDADVDVLSIVFTGIFNYAIPTFLIGLSVGTTGVRLVLKTLKKVTIVINVVEAFLGAPSIIIGALSDPRSLISTFGEIALGVIFSKGLSMLAVKITGYVTATEILEKAPIVGWIFEVASCAAGIADMLATTVEVLLSPATYNIEAARVINVQVDVSPDPTDGTKTQKPIWPLESDHWEVVVQYKGGTSVKQSGSMDSIKPDTPLSVLFSGGHGNFGCAGRADSSQLQHILCDRLALRQVDKLLGRGCCARWQQQHAHARRLYHRISSSAHGPDSVRSLSKARLQERASSLGAHDHSACGSLLREH